MQLLIIIFLGSCIVQTHCSFPYFKGYSFEKANCYITNATIDCGEQCTSDVAVNPCIQECNAVSDSCIGFASSLHNMQCTIIKIICQETSPSRFFYRKINSNDSYIGKGKLCNGMPCINGVCDDDVAMRNHSLSCKCHENYTGQSCDIMNYCASSPCHNNGTCLISPSENGDQFVCLCPAGTFGPNCEEQSCFENICQNGGSCVNTSAGSVCVCSQNFYGAFCENSLCNNVPCVNGTCEQDNSTAKNYCKCNPKYTGRSCDILDSCASSPCHNNGSCLNNPSGQWEQFFCICAPGTVGLRCENQPCLDSPCSNGSTCVVSGNGSRQCLCAEGFSGSSCDTTTPTCQITTAAPLPTTPKSCRASVFYVPPDVKTLYRNNYNIVSIDSCLSKLTLLQRLFLFSNKITALETGTFSGLHKLEILDLRFNQIATLATGCFDGLTKLHTLDLENNHLVSFSSAHLMQVPKLTYLNLRLNQLASVSLDVVEKVQTVLVSIPACQSSAFSDIPPSATTLNRTNNDIVSIEAGCFAGLSQLQLLHIEGNRLQSVPAGVFSSLVALQTLALQHNHITTLQRGCFSGLAQLQSLWLLGNRLTSVPTGVLSGLASLHTLSLYSNEIVMLEAGCFSGLDQLRMLYLYANRLTSVPAGVFSSLPQSMSVYVDSAATWPAGEYLGSIYRCPCPDCDCKPSLT